MFISFLIRFGPIGLWQGSTYISKLASTNTMPSSMAKLGEVIPMRHIPLCFYLPFKQITILKKYLIFQKKKVLHFQNLTVFFSSKYSNFKPSIIYYKYQHHSFFTTFKHFYSFLNDNLTGQMLVLILQFMLVPWIEP